ncbi:MAG: TadE/TadG family type IV pilus assembly protein [Parvibaculaceae bacterium]
MKHGVSIIGLLNRGFAAYRGFRRDHRGFAAVEMAFIFPVMILIYFGLVDGTNLLSAKRKITLAASTLGDLTTQAPGAITTTDLNDFYEALQPIMDPFPVSGMKITIRDYKLSTSGSSADKRWQNSSGGVCGEDATGAQKTEMATKLMTRGNDVVVASVCANVQPITGMVLGLSTFHLQSEVMYAPRQSKTLECTNC